jgi:hypothetical protein
MSAWPSISWTWRRSAPPSSIRVASVWCPSIEVARKLADVFGVTVDSLVSERELPDLLRDQKMIERWRSLDQLPGDEHDRILYVVDGLIRDAQARRAYAAR